MVGLEIGVALGWPLSSGSVWPAVIAVLLSVALWRTAVALAPASMRTWFLFVTAVAFFGRLALAASLHYVSVTLGRDGSITGDDGIYATLAWAWINYVQGTPLEPNVPPAWNGLLYLFGAYTYFVVGVFLVVGREPLVVTFINSAFSVTAALVLADVARRISGARAGQATMVGAAFFPSVLLWSTLNLKDAMVVLLSSLVVWAMELVRSRPHVLRLALIYLLLWPLWSLRLYVFFALDLLAPLALLLMRSGSRRRRLAWAAASALLSLALLLASGHVRVLTGPIESLVSFEVTRRAMTITARTAFAEPWEPPTTPAPAGRTRAPAVTVRPGATMPPGKTVGPEPTVIAGVTLQPGSTVPPSATYPPGATVEPRLAAPEGPSATVPPPNPQLGIIQRTLAHAPVGLAYSLFAPFPWAAERALDLVTVPDMLLWYLVLTAAVVSLWRSRHDQSGKVTIALFCSMVLVAFILTEGNVGSLFRHRGTIIPFVVVLASPSLVELYERVRTRSPRAKAM